MTLKDQSLCEADKSSILVTHVEPGGRHGQSQLHNMPLDVADMLSLAPHAGNRRCWGPNQFIPCFPGGPAHGQFIQVRNHICIGAFIPLMWDVPWGLLKQHMVQFSASRAPVMLMKASTSSKTLGAKPSPSGLQYLAFCSFLNILECTRLSFQPLLNTPPAPCCVFVQKLSNVHDHWSRWADGGVEMVISHLHMAISHRTRASAATSFPSVKGQMRGHHIGSSSSHCSLKPLYHLVVCHKGSILSLAEEELCTTQHKGASLSFLGHPS